MAHRERLHLDDAKLREPTDTNLKERTGSYMADNVDVTLTSRGRDGAAATQVGEIAGTSALIGVARGGPRKRQCRGTPFRRS